VFISYSEDAQVSPEAMSQLLQKFGKVKKYEKPLGRYRSNDRVNKQGHVTEHLYVLERD
jgi:adenine-specific DNA methylase